MKMVLPSDVCSYIVSNSMNRWMDRCTNTQGNNVHRDRRHHAVSTFAAAATCGLPSVLIAAWKCDIWWQKCFKENSWWLTDQTLCIYWLIPEFIPPPLNFCEASWFFPPIGWTHLTDTTKRQTNEQMDGRMDKRTNGETRLFVRPSLR